jgi:hypothetical protein
MSTQINSKTETKNRNLGSQVDIHNFKKKLYVHVSEKRIPKQKLKIEKVGQTEWTYTTSETSLINFR